MDGSAGIDQIDQEGGARMDARQMPAARCEEDGAQRQALRTAEVTKHRLGDHSDPESGVWCRWSKTDVSANYEALFGAVCPAGHPAQITVERKPVGTIVVTWSVTEQHRREIKGEELADLLTSEPDLVGPDGELDEDVLAEVLDPDNHCADYEGSDTYDGITDREIDSRDVIEVA